MSNTDPETEIRRVDETLSILRESWMDSKEDKKPHWMSRINAALDQRLIWMKQRKINA